MVIEERDLVYAAGADTRKRNLYYAHYSARPSASCCGTIGRWSLRTLRQTVDDCNGVVEIALPRVCAGGINEVGVPR